jgi:all-trans-retinol dehydrogenase (NAD+)
VQTSSFLINNAGILNSHTILNTPDEYLKKIFDVNVLSNWYTTKAFWPDMLRENKGHVVTVASVASFLGVAGLADYTASKAAVLSFHEGTCPTSRLPSVPCWLIIIALNQELKHHYNSPNVLTTSIHPSWVRTPLLGPVEEELKKQGAVIIEPTLVADTIVDRIVSCSGGQVFLPSSVSTASMLRGLPNWMQESVRSGASKAIYNSVK